MAPPILHVYSAVTALALPVLWRKRKVRLMSDGVDLPRAREVLGHATQARPAGRLIWFHAASVGESLSVLPIIDALRVDQPDLGVLITTATPTAARVLDKRMPDRCIHQFAPLDAKSCVDRFLAHWRPDALILAESEIWPHMLSRTAQRGIPTALVGARMSERSLARWAKRAPLFQYLTRNIRLFAAQNDQMAAALGDLGIADSHLCVSGNLKAFAPPLAVDQAELTSLENAMPKGPLWVAASTHAGEEEIVIEAHRLVQDSLPNARLILVPRHPERAEDVAQLLRTADMPFARRTKGEAPEAPVYLADTLGEMGLWYALSPIVFLGGSLRPIGGHNPYEVAHAGAAILSGPHVTNFAETYDLFTAQDAVRFAKDAQTLAQAVTQLLQDKAALDSARTASRGIVAQQDGTFAALITRLQSAVETPDG